MRRVCFIGDSHLAAVKLGWSAIAAEFSDVEPKFFAAGGTILSEMAVRDGAMVCTARKLARILQQRTNGLSEIDASYEFYVICGLELTVALALEAWRETGDGADDEFRRKMSRRIRRTVAFETLSKLRQITAAPAFLVPTPFSEDRIPKPLAHATAPGNARNIAAEFMKACRRAARNHEAQFVGWPIEAMTEDRLAIRAEYFREPAKLYPAGGPDDAHANAGYGALVAANILRHMLPEGPVAPRGRARLKESRG